MPWTSHRVHWSQMLLVQVPDRAEIDKTLLSVKNYPEVMLEGVQAGHVPQRFTRCAFLHLHSVFVTFGIISIKTFKLLSYLKHGINIYLPFNWESRVSQYPMSMFSVLLAIFTSICVSSASSWAVLFPLKTEATSCATDSWIPVGWDMDVILFHISWIWLCIYYFIF